MLGDIGAGDTNELISISISKQANLILEVNINQNYIHHVDVERLIEQPVCKSNTSERLTEQPGELVIMEYITCLGQYSFFET